MKEEVSNRHLEHLAEFIYHLDYKEQARFFRTYFNQFNFDCLGAKGTLEFNFPDINLQCTIKVNKVGEEIQKEETYIDKIRKTYPKAYLKWTIDDEHNLLLLYNGGNSISELSKIFERQPGGIISRLQKLGIELNEEELDLRNAEQYKKSNRYTYCNKRRRKT